MAAANFPTPVLYEGDNLHFMRGMNSSTVDLIATDPPFNKQKNFHATPGSLFRDEEFKKRWRWNDCVQQEWQDLLDGNNKNLMATIESANHTHSYGMAAFLCYISVRLLEMHRILKSTGSIYLHCDPTASHYIKACMDAIFGHENFRNEIVWQRSQSLKVSSRRLGSNRDIIFFYTKSDRYTFNLPRTGGYGKQEPPAHYKKSPDGRYFYKVKIFDPIKKGCEPRLKKPDRVGRPVQTGSKGQLYKIKYWEDDLGKPCDDIWTDIGPISALSKEWTGYLTQKPRSLYERIIATSSNKGDIVLDPFCGCATALIAAQKLERKWVGIDKWKGTKDLINKGMEQAMMSVKNAPSGSIVQLVKFKKTHEIPDRTDAKKTTSKSPKLIERQGKMPVMNKKKMMNWLLDLLKKECGGKLICPGCGTEFHNNIYMQLDHGTPKSNGGSDFVGNRIPICGPCNQTKSDRKTMTGLIEYNKKHERFPPSEERPLQRAKYLKGLVETLGDAAGKKEFEEILKYGRGEKCELFSVQLKVNPILPQV